MFSFFHAGILPEKRLSGACCLGKHADDDKQKDHAEHDPADGEPTPGEFCEERFQRVGGVVFGFLDESLGLIAPDLLAGFDLEGLHGDPDDGLAVFIF